MATQLTLSTVRTTVQHCACICIKMQNLLGTFKHLRHLGVYIPIWAGGDECRCHVTLFRNIQDRKPTLFMCTYLYHPYIYTYIHKYINTYIHRYVRTYVRTVCIYYFIEIIICDSDYECIYIILYNWLYIYWLHDVWFLLGIILCFLRSAFAEDVAKNQCRWLVRVRTRLVVAETLAFS